MRHVRPVFFAQHEATLEHVFAETKINDSWESGDFLELRRRFRRSMARVKARYGQTFHQQHPSLHSFGLARLKSLLSHPSGRRSVEPVKTFVSSSLSPYPSAAPTSTTISAHDALTSFVHLSGLYLRAKFHADSYQFIMDDRDPFRYGSSFLKHDDTTSFLLRTWNDFKPDSQIEKIEILFYAPTGSDKRWKCRIQEEWVRRVNGLWGWEAVVEIVEGGLDLPQGTLKGLR
ncbi:hypothetical protein HBH70_183290 [Parastagonospora nodorum]|nr:hypothetical protein HBH50_208880 [Parastagonospora nodorum]KAH4080746.1 hypothetical protein HBH48_207470 [Parastagonospora nodorum]KAH4208383.1 hypothetical protein HBI95_089930 [Parastagonospora nodorum]KAH5130788.1 hypothetical protein HBH70_183290 [Parastagonospora nodorum]KAH5632508.1 hypothetical protein HBI51_187850 [Parastagonospora nodorum]